MELPEPLETSSAWYEPLRTSQLPEDVNRQPAADCLHEWGRPQVTAVKVLRTEEVLLLMLRRCRRCFGWEISQ